MELTGRVAIVTGGASGIGRALVDRFVAEGMKVVIADIEPVALERARDEVAAAGREVLAVRADVTDAAAVRALSDAARERFGTYHVVCNNAGVIGHFGRSWELPDEDWRWVLDVNVWGVVNGIKAFVPTLVEQDEGHVVNTASVAGWQGVPGMGPYCASKHAVLAISETLRMELETSGSKVGVTALCPGPVETNLLAAERNWPATLGERPGAAEHPVPTLVREALRQGMASGPALADVAEAVVTGIRENRAVVSSHPEQLTAAAERRRMVAAGEWAALGGGG